MLQALQFYLWVPAIGLPPVGTSETTSADSAHHGMFYHCVWFLEYQWLHYDVTNY